MAQFDTKFISSNELIHRNGFNSDSGNGLFSGLRTKTTITFACMAANPSMMLRERDTFCNYNVVVFKSPSSSSLPFGESVKKRMFSGASLIEFAMFL